MRWCTLLFAAALLGAGCGGRAGRSAGSGGPADAGERVAASAAPDGFMRAFRLPVDPIGLAGHGGELVMANRVDPWGLVRVTLDGDDAVRVAKIPVVESRYRQNVGLDAVAWNGTSYVGYTDGSWFGRQGDVFTIHDPRTLEITRVEPAPPLLGALAWDGSGYWAATRRNTEDADEPAFLYRLGADFGVVARHEPPAVGCQGLAWDGDRLWWADVFTDSIYVLDVTGEEPVVVQSRAVSFNYLSGIATLNGRLFVTEYGDKRLLEVGPALRAALEAEVGAPTAEAPPVEEIPGAIVAETPASPAFDLETYKDKLRGDDWSVRMEAEMEASRVGLVPFDRAVDSFPDEEGPEEMEVLWWEAEIRDGTMYGSWDVFFGDALFTEAKEDGELVAMPTFARYTITVEGGTLAAPVETQLDARPGHDERHDVELASGLGPGRYEASLFMHVQYVKPDGGNQILNESAMGLDLGF